MINYLVVNEFGDNKLEKRLVNDLFKVNLKTHILTPAAISSRKIGSTDLGESRHLLLIIELQGRSKLSLMLSTK